MIPLLTADQMQRLDAHTIENVGVPGVVLMETAGRGVVRYLEEHLAAELDQGPVCVLCGRGNNGGDGFVIARCLHNLGVRVSAFLLGQQNQVRGDARVHLDAYLGSGGVLHEVAVADTAAAQDAVAGAALVIDALLGTGLDRDVGGLVAEAIAWINDAPATVVSVDVPSGVSADSGRVCGVAVRARHTVTFAYLKRGHHLYPGAAHVGRLQVVDIGIPPATLDSVSPDLWRFEDADLRGHLARPADAHKGTFGHVIVVGGSPGKAGAPALAGWAALRCGAGLATVLGPDGAGLDQRLPLELMNVPLPGTNWEQAHRDQVLGQLQLAGSLVVGPGMGTSPGAAAVCGALLGARGAPAVVDADALNLLAGSPSLAAAAASSLRSLVLTPHPGEAARLLGTDSRSVQADRVAAARALVERFHTAVVLKGAATLVGAPGEPMTLIAAGNPGMATAGTGDLLAGVIGALLARGLAGPDAARCGAQLHALAGDRAAQRIGADGMTAGDLAQELPAVLRDLSTLSAMMSR